MSEKRFKPEPSSASWGPIYKKAKTGKILSWHIFTDGNVMITQSGLQGGKISETRETIEFGKNIGRSNETSPTAQAISEARARYNKKIDQGYTQDLRAAQEGESEIEDGYFPMLAQSYDKHSDKITFPCYVQPKLDGMRATCVEGKFFSRSRKPLLALGHLEQEISRLGLSDWMLDGEIYNHEHRDQFEKIISAAKKVKGENPDTPKIQYHIYDVFEEGLDFSHRREILESFHATLEKHGSKLIHIVDSEIATDEEELLELYKHFMSSGYEGAMVRNMRGTYENRRSYDLQKLKEFMDDEFTVIDAVEGRGALKGAVGAFVCEIPEGYDEHGQRTFEAKLKGANVTAFLRDCMSDESLWKNRKLTVQFQGWTGKNVLPRFPVGVRFREEE